MVDYSHLNKYPNLKKFCEEEQVSLATDIRPFQVLRLQEIISVNITQVMRGDFDKRRFILDHCLGFAYKYGLMNTDRRRRLMSRDQNSWSIFGELRVGCWLESLGFSFSVFELSANNGKKGDYLISKNPKNSIFVEVKVFSGDREYYSRSDLLSQIAGLTQEIAPNINDITINEYEYIDIGNRRILLGKIERFLKDSSMPATFKDPKFHIEIAFDIKAGLPFSIGWAGSIGPEEKLSDLLRGVQLSIDPIPSLVFIYDFDSWASHDIENVLYGNSVMDTVNDIHYRKNDGVWDAHYQSPLTAVSILKFSPDNVFPSDVTIYLAPSAKYKMPTSTISAFGSKTMTLASNKYDLISLYNPTTLSK